MRTNFTHKSVHDSHTVKYIFTCMWAGVKVACACTADILYAYIFTLNYLVWRLISPSSERIWAQAARIFGCCFNDMVAAAALKDFETAMRRTGRWADGSLLTIDELGQAVGLNMFTADVAAMP